MEWRLSISQNNKNHQIGSKLEAWDFMKVNFSKILQREIVPLKFPQWLSFSMFI
jgi:hypothetical protein